MSTVIFGFSVFLIAIFILSVLPGIREIFRPMLVGLGLVTTAILKGSIVYILWGFKQLIKSHQLIYIHLTSKREELDVEYQARLWEENHQK